MVLFNKEYLFLLLSIIGCCYANIADYLKGTTRSFNAIEGNVITVKIIMTNEQYDQMIEESQMSLLEFGMKYHGKLPEDLKYETKVGVNFTINDETQSFENVRLKVGGNYGRTFSKLGFNLKLKKKQTFLGINNMRLRSDYMDVTHFRSKLAVDLLNKWDIPSIQETFCELYVNDHYYGLYILIDAIKPSWIKSHYDIPEEEEVKTLYDCGEIGDFTPENVLLCKNEEDEYLNYTEPLRDTFTKIYNLTSVKELSKYVDVETARKSIISEYLFSSFDHFLVSGNNYHLYQQSNGKWQILLHDFDTIFLSQFEGAIAKAQFDIQKHNDVLEYAKVKFDDWSVPGNRKPIVEVLYYHDQENFKKVLREMMVTGFNPDELFPRIDELAEFVAPYVQKDITPDADGNYPGQVNTIGQINRYTMDMFWDATKYENINGNIGLKKFIQTKFDAVCEHYKFDKNQLLTDAKIYRKKRALNQSIDELKQQIADLKEKLKTLFTEMIKEKIKKLTDQLNKLLE
jgi:spore coat protein CotH